jgi:hypothetical protein
VAPEILEENGTWLVLVDCELRGVQKYSCATEKQAQQLASLFQLPARDRRRRAQSSRHRS